MENKTLAYLSIITNITWAVAQSVFQLVKQGWLYKYQLPHKNPCVWTGPVGWWRPGLESATQSGQPGRGVSSHCTPKGFACFVSGWGDLVLTQRLGIAVLGSEWECCRKCREEEAGIWPSKENSGVLGKQRIFPKVACCLSQFCVLVRFFTMHQRKFGSKNQADLFQPFETTS